MSDKLPIAGKLGDLVKKIPLPDITKLFTNLTDAYKEHALTEREIAKVAAQKEVVLAEIVARHETYRMVFDNIFAERRVVIDHLFNTIDKGLVANDKQLVLGAIEGLSRIVATSPFSNTQELSRLLESKTNIEL